MAVPYQCHDILILMMEWISLLGATNYQRWKSTIVSRTMCWVSFLDDVKACIEKSLQTLRLYTKRMIFVSKWRSWKNSFCLREWMGSTIDPRKWWLRCVGEKIKTTIKFFFTCHSSLLQWATNGSALQFISWSFWNGSSFNSFIGIPLNYDHCTRTKPTLTYPSNLAFTNGNVTSKFFW